MFIFPFVLEAQAALESNVFDIVKQLAPIIIVMAIFYFLILRPQQQKAKKHQEMLANLRRGDKVVTSGGFIGTIDKIITDHEVSLEIADGVKVKILKNCISDTFAKTLPVVNDSNTDLNNNKSGDVEKNPADEKKSKAAKVPANKKSKSSTEK